MCLRPLWLLLGGFAALSGVVAICHFYAKRGADRAEQLARTKLTVFLTATLSGALLLWHFVALCALDAKCREGIDLNCNGVRPAVYQVLSIVAFVAAAGVVAFEIRRQLR